LVPSACVSREGVVCVAPVTNGGRTHVPAVVGVVKTRELPQFKWVNSVLRNLATTLAGAVHSLNCRK